MAYLIKKQSQAFLAILNFQLDPVNLSNLEKKLNAESVGSKILRYMILTKEEPKIIRQKYKKAEIPVIIKKKKTVESEKEKKVELKEIEKKLDEILKE